MVQRDVQTIAQALSYTAGVQTGNFGFDRRYDQFALRVSLRPPNVMLTTLNGMRQRASGWLAYFGSEPYGLERIDVIKGPARVLYRPGPAGGIVNQFTKAPPRLRLVDASTAIRNVTVIRDSLIS